MMDNKTARALSTDLNAAIAETLAKYGFKGQVISVRYDDAGFQCTIKAASNDPTVAEAGKRAEFERYASLYGVAPQAFGVEFTSGGRRFKFTGLVGGRSTKYVFTAVEVATGKEYKFGSDLADRLNALVGAAMLDAAAKTA